MTPLPMLLRTLAMLVLLAAAPPSHAQTVGAPSPLREMGDEVTLAASFDTLYRLSEELVFWQSVSIMGGVYDWRVEYTAGGRDQIAWTLRLYNALDESEIEAIRAGQAIARNRVASAEDKAAGAGLLAHHVALRGHAQTVHDLLLEGQPEAAAAHFQEHTLPLRRQIANLSFSTQRTIRNRIASAARTR